MSDQYAYWSAALAGAKPQIIIDEPMPGFYRSRRKTGLPTPLAIWSENGEVKGRLGDQDLTRDRLNELWSFCATHPITEEVYRAVAERGEPWPDIDGAVHDHMIGPGHNNPPTDPTELLREQIDAASKGADDYALIESDEALTRAQTLRSRLLELRKSADDHRVTEKQPHQDAAKSVDEKWMPLVKRAKELADKINAAMNAWGTKKHEAAEKQRREIEDANRKAAEANKPAPAPPPIVAAAPAVVKGAVGRAASGRPVNVVKAVTDQDAAYSYLKEQPEVRDAIKEAAQRLVTAGHTVPGTEVKEEIRYR